MKMFCFRSEENKAKTSDQIGKHFDFVMAWTGWTTAGRGSYMLTDVFVIIHLFHNKDTQECSYELKLEMKVAWSQRSCYSQVARDLMKCFVSDYIKIENFRTIKLSDKSLSDSLFVRTLVMSAIFFVQKF